MQRNIIKKEVPEKIDRAEVYRLIKDTEVICVDNMKLRIQDGLWYLTVRQEYTSEIFLQIKNGSHI